MRATMVSTIGRSTATWWRVAVVGALMIMAATGFGMLWRPGTAAEVALPAARAVSERAVVPPEILAQVTHTGGTGQTSERAVVPPEILAQVAGRSGADRAKQRAVVPPEILAQMARTSGAE